MGELASFFVVSLSAIFFVVDPVSLVPIFLGMTARDSAEKRREMAKRACWVAFGLLTFFALFGGLVFKVFGVTLGAFRVAGGILLLITALDLLRAKTSPTRTSPEETQEGASKEDVAIVPLAMPLLAGPGAIATAMVVMARASGTAQTVSVILCIVLTMVASHFILRGAGLVQRVLGVSGIAVMQRVMGLLLGAIAVQFIADGVKALAA
jgi:multiple antibiotic resistance protein